MDPSLSRRNFKDRLYDQFARIGKALANPGRLELLDLLAQGERTVEVLAGLAGLSVANTSHHLQTLRDACLVEARKEGLYVYYRLAHPTVFALLRALHTLADARLADVERLVDAYLGSRDTLEPMGRDELRERLGHGTVTVLDVRPRTEFDAGHLPQAVCIPIDELEHRLSELPADREIVAYCRGPYCVFAYEAVETLRAAGRQALRLVDGFPEWRAEGLPVEMSP